MVSPPLGLVIRGFTFYGAALWVYLPFMTRCSGAEKSSFFTGTQKLQTQGLGFRVVAGLLSLACGLFNLFFPLSCE